MSLKIRDGNNKFIMDFNETNKSIIVREYEPTTFNSNDGEYNYGLTASYEYLNNGLNGQPIYGSFHSETTQTADATNTFYNPTTNIGVVWMGTTDMNNGILNTTYGSRVKYLYKGIYNYQFSLQLDMSSGSGQHVYIWLRKNGIDLTWTASEVAIQGTSAETIPSWNFLLDINKDDYIELMWSATSDKVIIKAVAPNSIPGIPSVIVTTWKL